MSQSKGLGAAKSGLLRQKDRLSRCEPIPMAVILIPFLAAMVLSLYTSLESHRRLHAQGKPMEYPAPESPTQSLWLSVSVVSGKVVVTTSGTERFAWAEAGPSAEDLKGLDAYLNLSARELVETTVRTGQIHKHSHTAAIAVDHSLTFHHVRPIIYALGRAGFSRYGFETRIVRQ